MAMGNDICGDNMQGSTHGQQNTIGSASGEVIVQFTATTNDMTFDACQSDYDSLIRIYDAGLHSQIDYNDDHGGRCNSNNWYSSHLHTTSLQAGVTYNLVIEGYGSNHGNYRVDVHCGGQMAMGNDICGDNMQGSTHGQQNTVGSASGEVIVEFTATTNDMTFDACQSDYDSYLRIYDAGLHNQIAANDDHGGRCNGNNWYASYLHTTSLQAGVTYKLVIEGYGGNHGNYQVTVHCGRGHAESEVGEAILNQGAYIKSKSEAKKSEALKAKTARQAETKLGTFIGSASKDKEE